MGGRWLFRPLRLRERGRTSQLDPSDKTPEGATHFVAPTSACTRSTCTSTGRAFGRDKGRSLYTKGRRRRWLHRKPFRPFGYRLLNEAVGRHTVCSKYSRLVARARGAVWATDL